MSSLIVTDISLENRDTESREQVSAWIVNRITEVFIGIKRKFDTLSLKTDKISRLYAELEDIYNTISSGQNPGLTNKESGKKMMESFFRKTDRFRIALIQLLLEQNESRLFEENIMNEAFRVLSDCLSKEFLKSDNPRYIHLNSMLQNMGEQFPLDRLNQMRSLLSEILSLFFTCEHDKKILLKRVQNLTRLISSLQMQPISIQDLETIRSFSDKLCSIQTIPDLNEQMTQLDHIRDKLSALAHKVSGFEHYDMSDLKRESNNLSEEEAAIIKRQVEKVISSTEAGFYHDRIRFFDYDNTESQDYEPVRTDVTMDQLALQRENLLLEYGLLKEKIPEKTVIREQLEEMIQNLSLEPDAGSLLDAALLLYHEPFPELREMVIIRKQYDAYFIEKAENSLSDTTWENIIRMLLEKLQEKGYFVPTRRLVSLRDFFRRSVLEIMTPVHNYSILISLNPLDELVFRLVRIVDDMDIQDLDRDEIVKKDGNAAKMWSVDYDEISRNMQENHISFIERLRKNPDEVHVQQLTRFDLLTDEHIS